MHEVGPAFPKVTATILTPRDAKIIPVDGSINVPFVTQGTVSTPATKRMAIPSRPKSPQVATKS
jgi:hypothetical protein